MFVKRSGQSFLGPSYAFCEDCRIDQMTSLVSSFLLVCLALWLCKWCCIRVFTWMIRPSSKLWWVCLDLKRKHRPQWLICAGQGGIHLVCQLVTFDVIFCSALTWPRFLDILHTAMIAATNWDIFISNWGNNAILDHISWWVRSAHDLETVPTISRTLAVSVSLPYLWIAVWTTAQTTVAMTVSDESHYRLRHHTLKFLIPRL